MLAIEILMQTVVIAGSVLKQQRRRFVLAISMTALDVICMLGGIARVAAEEFVPAVRYWSKLWIDECTKTRNDSGQRILEVLVFSTAETMPLHHHATAEKVIARKQRGYLFAFSGRKDAFNNCVAFRVEIFCTLRPVNSRKSLLNTSGWNRG